MIKFEQVHKSYSGSSGGLIAANLTINTGEMVFITGHSGAGKTTLIKLIAMLEKPTRGNIYLNNVNLGFVKSKHIPRVRRQMGLIMQQPYLLNEKTVLENTAMPLVLNGMRQDEAYKRAQAALEKLNLFDKQAARPLELSSGEQQRVSIARAVATKPALILADEPTGNCDPVLSREIMRVFEAFNSVGTTVLVATHDLSLIASMGYRMITLDQGQVACDGV